MKPTNTSHSHLCLELQRKQEVNPQRPVSQMGEKGCRKRRADRYGKNTNQDTVTQRYSETLKVRERIRVVALPPLSLCRRERLDVACGDLLQTPGPKHWAFCLYLRPPDHCRLYRRREGERRCRRGNGMREEIRNQI